MGKDIVPNVREDRHSPSEPAGVLFTGTDHVVQTLFARGTATKLKRSLILCFPPSAMATAILLSSVALANAGPCAAQISQVEQEIKTAAANPLEGPSASQTIGAQLGRQPTPSTVQSAQQKAETLAEEALQNARQADAAGDADACQQALRRLRNLYGLSQASF
jgi:hypothetical protein